MLLAKRFKTHEGASKYARFENHIRPREDWRTDAARKHRFRVVQIGELWGIERYTPTPEPTAKAIEEANHLAHQVGFRF